ncbi:MAG TPA: ABC transporter ATP-binding protein [Acidimicrobiales bacterium]|nr:ABC transporter ATP-binding protein [Acidimicrobiales bacterium]
MISTLEHDLDRLATPDLDVGSPYEPVGVSARYGPPKATIHPDRDRSWLRRMGPLIAARKLAFTGSLLAALVAMLAQVAVPRIVMAGIDNALTEPHTSEIMPFVWAILALGAVRGAFTFVYRYHLYRIAYDLEYDLRVNMFTKLTGLSFSFFDRVQSGQLISRANSDIRSVQMFLTFAPLMALQVVSFLFAFGLMLAVHVPLAIVALLPLPFVYLVGARMRDLMFPISWIVQSRLADVATTVEENVTGARVVKSFAAEEPQIAHLAGAARRLRWAAVRQIDVRAGYGPLMENLPRVGMALVLLYGGILTINGQVTVGTLVAFSTYVVMLQAPFRMLGFLLLLSQRASASAGRIFEVLDEQPAIADRPGAVDLVDPEGEVRFEDVTFRYGHGLTVLDGLDLTLAPGETVAVVGRTGSGKSTLARLLTRFYDVESGTVRIDGHDVRDLTLASLRAQVAMVLDEPFLFSATIRENIAYGRPDATDDEVRAAAVAADAAGFIDDLPVGYDTEVGERGYTLSGGQRQRIAIARTLLIDPRVLILDDATSAIDVHVEERIHRALAELLGRRTTLVIAHRLSTIALADRVVLLEDGRIVADGTHSELMASEPRYTEVLAHVEEESAAAEASAAAGGLVDVTDFNDAEVR